MTIREEDRPLFLETPTRIREEVGKLGKAPRMDLAVAFIGRDWRDSLADFRGKLRVVCWLSSTNTDPRAVRQMLTRKQTAVRQRDGMHAKVYLALGRGAVVGSANLSRQALAEIEQNGRDEAGVLVSDSRNVETVTRWFERLWTHESTRKILKGDIDRAVVAFDKAHAHGKGGPGVKKSKKVENLPQQRRARLRYLADKVRDIDLARVDFHRVLRDVVPERISRGRVIEIVDQFEDWVGRRFLFERALVRRPLPRVRQALGRLFDEGRDVDERLRAAIRSRDLAPLGVSTLSLLLCWRAPWKYPPFNLRTRRFLRDFRLSARGASASSPLTYARWLDQAERIAQSLRLPTPGHVDRLVWEYTKDMKI